MIKSFGNRLAKEIFEEVESKAVLKLSRELRRVVRRKLLYLYDAENLADLRVPPGNRLKALKGDLLGYYSIRINDQYRLILTWEEQHADDVRVVDYH